MFFMILYIDSRNLETLHWIVIYYITLYSNFVKWDWTNYIKLIFKYTCLKPWNV